MCYKKKGYVYELNNKSGSLIQFMILRPLHVLF